MIVKIAECYLDINNKYDYSNEFFAEYKVEEPARETVESIAVSEQEIDREQEGYDQVFDRGYLETLAILRKIAEVFAQMDIILMHGVAITYEDDCYIFTARSGMGKSTHAFLWNKYLGGNVKIINGDKPFIKIKEKGLTVFGTPWCGKENIQINTSAQLKGIVFLERGNVPEISRLEPAMVTPRLLAQLHLTQSHPERTLKLCDYVVNNIPCYLLKCDISRESVKVCFEKITGKLMPKENLD